MKAMTEATRSISEWIASVMIAIEPVIAPAASLSAIRIELEAIESAGGAAFGADHGAASGSRPRWRASIRAALPRWLIACFSSGLSSAIVRWSPGPVSSGTKAGS